MKQMLNENGFAMFSKILQGFDPFVQQLRTRSLNPNYSGNIYQN